MKVSDWLRKSAALLDKWERVNRSKFVKVWKVKDCPKEIMDCFENHDDIDYIAFVPESLRDDYLRFLEQPHFGCCNVEEHDVVGGKVVVGYHS